MAALHPRPILVACALSAVVAAPMALFDDPVQARTAAVAGVCLALWLLEFVPAFVPTLILCAAAPVVVGARLVDVLAWTADPVLALFFGGFALARAAERHGLAERLAAIVLRAAGGRRAALVVGVLCAAALLSMWMSNIAAAALLLATVKPLAGDDRRFHGALALAVAMGANVGGIATPVGTGPNAIAIAAAPAPISFLAWMAFALPLTLGLLVVVGALVLLRFRVAGRFDLAALPATAPPASSRAGWVLVVFAATIALWLAEPLHGVPAAVVALAAAATLFTTRLLEKRDLQQIDWSTLLLIAGGLAVGRLLEHGGLVRAPVARLDVEGASPFVVTFALVLGAAVSSAIMSNTATAALLVPIAATLVPGPATLVIVAVGCSLGMPFIVSTPPNAMAHGTGAVSSRDLLHVGLPTMLGGALLVAWTGPRVLAWFGL